MPLHFRSAAIRSVLVTVLIVAWVLFYDGPTWAWAMLAVYILCTFGVAMYLQKRIMPKPKQSGSKE